MIRIAAASFLGLVIAVGGPACSKDEKKDEAPVDEGRLTRPMPPDETAEDETPEVDPKAAAAAIETVMKPYEDCRALLAADDAKVADCAKAMADAAAKGKDAVAEAARPHMTTVASAATKLAEMSADDIDALRLVYGDVSKAVVALLTATPEVAREYHVFECPMAKGYKRWAQPQAKLANPYMGTAMLECGSEVHDHHKGMMKDGHMMGGDQMKGGDHMGHE